MRRAQRPPHRAAARARRGLLGACLAGLCASAWAGGTGGAAGSGGGVDERELKAAYLFNFIQFTHWPTTPEHPFGLCVLGQTPIDDALASLEGKAVLGGPRIAVRHVGLHDAFTGCHAMYVDDTQRGAVDATLLRLSGLPVLTVTDGDGLADKGLMIEIHRRDARLAFEVNLRAARAANLSFSARMLKLASYVAGAQ